MILLAKSLIIGTIAALSAEWVALSVNVQIDGPFLIGLGGLATGIATAYGIIRNRQATERVYHEVKTMNAQSMAQLADASETRRIEKKSDAGQPLTTTEQGHADSVDEAGRGKPGHEPEKR